MPPILTTDGYVAVGKQSVFGTAVAPTAGMAIKYLSEDVKNEQEELKGEEGGQGRYMIENYKVSHKVSGTVSAYLRPNIFGFFLGMFMGKDTLVSATGVTPSIHTYEVAAPHPFTIERGIKPATPTLIERFKDMHVNELTIEGESSKPLKFTAGMIGTLGNKEAAATAVTYETNDPIMFFSTPTYTVDGAGTVEISKFNIKMSNNIDAWFGPSISPSTMIYQLLTIELGFTLKFIDAVHYAKVYYGASTAPVGVFADGSFRVQAGYGAAATLRSIDLQIKHIKHVGAPVNLAGSAGPIFQECVGFAIKSGADNLIDPIVKNSYDTDYDT